MQVYNEQKKSDQEVQWKVAKLRPSLSLTTYYIKQKAAPHLVNF